MKKTLLLLALAFTAFGAKAGSWTEPTLNTSTTIQVSTESDTIYQYLYHVGRKQLLTKGATWGTRAVLDSLGTAAFPYVICQDEVGYTLWSPSANNLGYLFRNGSADVYTDYNSNSSASTQFEIYLASSGYLHIRTAAASEYWGSDSYGEDETNYGLYELGWDPNGDDLNSSSVSLGTNQAVYMLDTSYDDIELDWAIVSEDDYLLYQAQCTLYNALNSAEAAGVATASAESVYNSSTSIEALNEAAADLTTAIANKVYAEASEDNPVDITDLVMTNADFSAGNLDGWTQENSVFSYDSTTYPNSNGTASDYNGDETFTNSVAGWVSSSSSLGDENIYQELTDLPAGKYVFTCSMVAQHGTDMPTGVYIYANSSTISNSLECQHDEDLWATAVDAGANNQLIMHPELEFVHTGGDLTVGLKLVSTNCNWVYASYFKIIYYGPSSDNAYLLALQSAISTAETYADTETYVYSTETAATLADAINDATALTLTSASDEEYTAATESLNAVVTTVKAEIEAYTTFATYVETMAADIAKYEEADLGVVAEGLYDLYDEVAAHLEDRDLTTDEIATYVDAYEDLINSLLAEAMKDATEDTPVDVTSLYIVNADFSDGSLDPWQNTTGVLVYSSDTFPNSSCNVTTLNDNESFTTAIAGWVSSSSSLGDDDVYQTISNVPAGSYVVSCSMVAQHGTEMPTGVYLYTQSSGLETTTVCQHDQELYDNITENYDTMTDDGGTFNQLMIHPKHVFYHLGGDLVIGVRLVSTNCNWVYASNFTLSYAGESVSALYAAMQAMAAQAEELMDEAQVVAEADSKLNDAIGAAEDCAEDDEEGIVAVMEQLQEAMEYANTSISLYSELEYDYIIYAEYLIGEVESEDDTFPELIEEIGSAIEDGFESNEQMENYISALQSGYTAYVQYPVLETASEEEPGDMTAAILNADFEGITGTAGADYWTITTSGGTNGAGSNAYECYNNTSFDVSQTITGLAAGAYKVRCQGFYRAGTTAVNADSIAANPDYGQNVTFYANTVTTPLTNSTSDALTEATGEDGETSATIGETTYYMPNSMTCAAAYFDLDLYWNEIDVMVDEEGTLTIGLKKTENISSDWTIFNKFELYYMGTETPTAIQGVEADTEAANAAGKSIYDLSGRRVSKAQKGVYIIDGKKVLVK